MRVYTQDRAARQRAGDRDPPRWAHYAWPLVAAATVLVILVGLLG